MLVPGVQTLTPGQGATDTPHLTIATSAGAGASAAKRALYVDISPKPKMHVYAPGEKDGIPVALTIDPHPSLKVAPAVFPPPEKYYFEPLKLTQLVFSKPFRITLPFSLPGSSTGAPLTVQGSVRYQACDDRVCYLPKTVKLSWTVRP
jgi:DsbC/DsbD-like thiol-disulfide interchange protein